MLESFRFLLRKESLVAGLRIDPSTFAMKLVAPDGGELSPERLSAGERQLLAVSTIWGLARASGRPTAKIPTDSNVEMTWKVFGGAHHELYLALLKARCRRDGLGTDHETLTAQFRLHLHRGIGYLFADRRIERIADLFRKLPLDQRG